MTHLKTMTELEILQEAYNSILDKWAKEYDRLEENPKSQIAKHWESIYSKKKNELHAKLIEIENT